MRNRARWRKTRVNRCNVSPRDMCIYIYDMYVHSVVTCTIGAVYIIILLYVRTRAMHIARHCNNARKTHGSCQTRSGKHLSYTTSSAAGAARTFETSDLTHARIECQVHRVHNIHISIAEAVVSSPAVHCSTHSTTHTHTHIILYPYAPRFPYSFQMQRNAFLDLGARMHVAVVSRHGRVYTNGPGRMINVAERTRCK